MGTQKLFRNTLNVGTLTVDKTLTASSDFDVAGALAASGTLTLSTGMVVPTVTAGSSETIPQTGLVSFISTGKGTHLHNFTGAPVTGQTLTLFNTLMSGSSSINKCIATTEFGSVTIVSTGIVNGRSVTIGTPGTAANGNGAYAVLIGLSTVQWGLIGGEPSSGVFVTTSTSTG